MSLKITLEIENKIKELAAIGLNATDISKEIGCISRATVENWCKKTGISINKGKKRSTELENKYNEFELLLKSGMTITKAKAIVKIPTGSAHRIIKERNLKEFTRNRAEAAKEDKAISLEEANRRIPKDNGKVVSLEISPKTNKPIYKIEALDGFVYYKTRSALYQGDPRGKSGTKIELEEVKKELLSIGYEYVNGWSIKRNPVKAKHIKCGYVRENRLNNFYEQECPKCSNTGVSRQELGLRDWVESLGFITEKYKFESQKTNSKTLDIYIPDQKIAIEFNGLYWHSYLGLKRAFVEYTDSDIKAHHFNKMKIANKQGIRLITIFSHEWENRRPQVENFLKSVLNKNNTTIHARKSLVKEIPADVGRVFMEENHIQGATSKSIIYFGLFYKDKLVAAMSMGNHPRGGDGFSIVLDRLCFLNGVKVHGGASKLLSVAKKWAKEQNYQGIVSWSDNRWSEGKVYEKMGFYLAKELDPDFFYIKGNKVYSKQSLKKTKEEKLTEKTEKEIRREQGYDTVWDCGKKRWILSLIN